MRVFGYVMIGIAWTVILCVIVKELFDWWCPRLTAAQLKTARGFALMIHFGVLRPVKGPGGNGWQ